MATKIPLYVDNEIFETSDDYNLYVNDKAEFNVTLTLYNNCAENNRVDKSNYLFNPISFRGLFKTPTSLTSPILIVSGGIEISNKNYAYIEELHRYYFITDIISIRNGVWELVLNVDVLYTYNDYIKELTGFIERSENLSTPSITDERNTILGTYDYTTVDITTDTEYNIFGGVPQDKRFCISGMGFSI